MLGVAADLGCSGTDAVCLCNNPNFSYGVRDCSNQICDSQAAADTIQYGVSYCSSAGVVVPTTAVSISPSAASSTATATGSETSSVSTTCDLPFARHVY